MPAQGMGGQTQCAICRLRLTKAAHCMFLRCLRDVALIASAAMALAGCEREERRFNEPASAALAPNSIALSELQPGTSTPEHSGQGYEGNAYAMSEGKRLFE